MKTAHEISVAIMDKIERHELEDPLGSHLVWNNDKGFYWLQAESVVSTGTIVVVEAEADASLWHELKIAHECGEVNRGMVGELAANLRERLDERRHCLISAVHMPGAVIFSIYGADKYQRAQLTLETDQLTNGERTSLYKHMLTAGAKSVYVNTHEGRPLMMWANSIVQRVLYR